MSDIITTRSQSVATLTPAAEIAEFKNSVKIQNHKQATVDTYCSAIEMFFLWAADKRIATIQATDLIEYKKELFEKGASSSTVRLYMMAVKQFYTWRSKARDCDDIMKDVELPKKKSGFIKMHLNKDQTIKLWEYAKTESLRNWAMLQLVARTGLRENEVAQANVNDIETYAGRRVLWIHGKGHDTKDRYVIITDSCYAPLKEYLDSRNAKSGEPLFTTYDGEATRLSNRTLRRIAKDGLRAIGLDGKEYSFHSLRHTAIVGIVRQTKGNYQVAQHTAGHKSSVTTQGYAESIREEERLERGGEDFLDEYYK